MQMMGWVTMYSEGLQCESWLSNLHRLAIPTVATFIFISKHHWSVTNFELCASPRVILQESVSEVLSTSLS